MKLVGKPTHFTIFLLTIWISTWCYYYYYYYAERNTLDTLVSPLQGGIVDNTYDALSNDSSRVMIPCHCGDNLQESRKKRLQSWCDQNPGNRSEMKTLSKLTKMAYVDETRKLIYCDVPKVATTNWKRVLLYLSGKWNVSKPENIAAKDAHRLPVLEESVSRLQKYSSDEIQLRLSTYIKFFFARHPMERLVSAFRNKFHNPNNTYFPERYGRQIIKNYRREASNHSLERGDDVSFAEFVEYLTDPIARGFDKNEHWAPIIDLCHPCDIHYDFVGQLETLNNDADAILARAGVIGTVRFPERISTYGTLAPSATLLASTFRNVPHTKIRQLLAIYRADMEAFGYNCSCHQSDVG